MCVCLITVYVIPSTLHMPMPVCHGGFTHINENES